MLLLLMLRLPLGLVLRLLLGLLLRLPLGLRVLLGLTVWLGVTVRGNAAWAVGAANEFDVLPREAGVGRGVFCKN